MDPPEEQVTTPLIPKHGIPFTVPDRRESYQKKIAIYLILASTLFERLAFYALITTLSTSLQSTEASCSDRHNNTALYLFSGITYISTLFFAIISDWKLGRAKTIIIGFTWYLIGLGSFTATATGQTFLCRFNESTHEQSPVICQTQCSRIILTTLAFTAIGAGAIKSNIVVFGAEQIQTSKTTSRYFDKYVFAVNIGSVIATLAIPFIQNIREDKYFLPYPFAVAMLIIATVLFFIGWPYYLHIPTNETVILKCIPVLINAFQTWFKIREQRRLRDRQRRLSPSSHLMNASQSVSSIEASTDVDRQPTSFLDYAKAVNQGKYIDRIVDDVKSLRRALIVFTLLIPFWLVYNQVNTTFMSQSAQMYNSGPDFIASWMSLGDPVTIIIGIVIFNLFIYKCFHVQHQASTILIKFTIGMFCACISMCIAGTVERFRQKQCNNDTGVSDLSIFVQIPQNIFIGFSQLFAMVASYEYAYFAAPLSAQSLFMSLHFCSAGISSFISTLFINYFPKRDIQLDFVCNEENRPWYWSFYTYFFILGGIQLIIMFIFILCQKIFELVKLNRQQMEKSQFLRH